MGKRSLQQLVCTLGLFLFASLPALADEPNSFFSGTVVDVQGDPIEDARVVFASYPEMSAAFAKQDQSLTEVQSDSAGKFEMPCESVSTRDSVAYGLIYKPGFVPWIRQSGAGRVSFVTKRADHGRIELQPSKSVTVTVGDTEDRSVSLQSVRVNYCQFGTNNVSLSLPAAFSDLLPIAVRENHVVLDWMPSEGWVMLSAEVNGIKHELSLSCETDSIQVMLPATTKLYGEIKMEDGSEVPKALLRDMKLALGVNPARLPESQVEDAPTPKYSVRQISSVDIAPDGTFEVECMVGTASLNLRKGASYISTQMIDLKLGQKNDVELTVAKPRIARGRIVDESGEPIEGVKVQGLSDSGGRREGQAISDMRGEFELEFFAKKSISPHIDSVPEGYIEPLGHYDRINLEKFEADEVIAIPEITLIKTTPVSGRVVDEGGAPVAGADVVARWIFQEDSYSTVKSDKAVTDAEGNFTLTGTQGGVNLGFVASTHDMASTELLIATPSPDAEPIEISISSTGSAGCTVKVTDRSGRPVEDAKIQLMARTEMLRSNYPSSVKYILPRQDCRTDKLGVFTFPEKLFRMREYSIRVTADGSVDYERVGIKMPADGDLMIDGVVLETPRTIEGVVQDSSGNPVGDARVWAHGIGGEHSYSRNRARSKGRSVITDESGTFSLKNIHPDARFVFVSKPGMISSGVEIDDDEPARLTLRTKSETISDPVKIAWQRSDETSQALENQLEARRERDGSRYARDKILNALIRTDSVRLEELLKEGYFRELGQARIFAYRGQVEDALETCQSIESLSSRVRALRACATDAKDKSQKIAYLEEAAFEVKNIMKVGSRLEAASGVVDDLLDIGKFSAGILLVKAIMPSALDLDSEGRNEYSKAWFAKAACRVDYENSWKLIEDSKTSDNRTSGGFTRHCGNMAHELAAREPERAGKLLQELDENGRKRYVPRVAYRIAKKDPTRAVDLLVRLLPPEPESPKNRGSMGHFSSGYGAVATIIADTDREKAKELLQYAIDAYMPRRRQQYEFGTGLNLLVYATEIDPLMAEEVFWELMDIYSNPNVSNYNPDDTVKARLMQLSEQAFLLGLTGRFPAVQSLSVEKIYETYEGEEELTGGLSEAIHDNPVCFASLAMTDPARAVAWCEALYERIPENSRRRLPTPWVIVSNTLSRDGKSICRYLAGEILYQWVIDKED